MATAYISSINSSSKGIVGEAYGSTAADRSVLQLNRYLGTPASPADLSGSDIALGQMVFNARNSGTNVPVATLSAATVGADPSSGRVAISTKPQAGSLAERFSIGESGQLSSTAAAGDSALLVQGTSAKLVLESSGASSQIQLKSSSTAAASIELTSAGGVLVDVAKKVVIDTDDTVDGISIGLNTPAVPVKIGNPTSEVSIGQNLVVNGNLTVKGTSTTVDSETTLVKDNLIVLNSGAASTYDSGFLVERFQKNNDTGAGDVVADVSTRTVPVLTFEAPNKINIGNRGPSDRYVNDYYTGGWIRFVDTPNEVRKILVHSGNGVDAGYIEYDATTVGNFSFTPAPDDDFEVYLNNYAAVYFDESENTMKLQFVRKDATLAQINETDPMYIGLQCGALDAGTVKTNEVTINGLSANQAVVTDGSSNLITIPYGTTATASSIVQRDSSANITANTFIANGLAANSALYLGAGKNLLGVALNDGELLIGSTGAAPVAATLSGTANQVLVQNDPGAIVLSTPQDIAPASSPTFVNLSLNSGKLNLQNGDSCVRFFKTGNSFYTELKGNNAIAQNYSYTLPVDYGTAGFGLSTDGAGALSWANFQPGDAGLTSLAALNTKGIISYTDTDTYTARTLTSAVATAASLTITNGTGELGNPTFELAQNIDATASPSFAALTISSGGINSTGAFISAGSATLTGGAIQLGGASDAAQIDIGHLGNAARTINIGDNAQANVLKVGSTSGAAKLTLQSGSGGFVLSGATGTGSITLGATTLSTAALDADATGAIQLNADANNIGIGNKSGVGSINLGTLGARTITLGNSDAVLLKGEAKQVDIVSGSNGTNLTSTSVSNGIKIGTTASGVPISIGHTTSETTVNDNLTVSGDLNVVGSININTIGFNDSTLVINQNTTKRRDTGFLFERFQTNNDTGTGDVVSDAPALTATATGGTTTTIELTESTGNFTTAGFYDGWWVKVTTANANQNFVRQIVAHTFTAPDAVEFAVSGTFPFATAITTETFNLYNQNFKGVIYDESADRFVLGGIANNYNDDDEFAPAQLGAPSVLNIGGLIVNDDPTATLPPGYVVAVDGDATAATWFASSSRLYKRDIEDLSDERVDEVLRSLAPKQFRWRSGHKDHGKDVHYGLIAEEVAATLPVAAAADAKSVDYMMFVPFLIKEVQRLRTALAELQSKI